MEYISAEEFLKQPKEVQRIFLEYFDHEKMLFLDGVIYFETFKDEGKHIPLLTEGQLRKFIEDKTKGIVKVIQWNPCVDDNRYGYTIYILAKNEYKVLRHIEYKKLGTDLLQAYWKVACEIASGEVNKHEQLS